MDFLFTQCAAVLFDRVPKLDELETALESWNVVRPQDAAPGEDGWVTSGPGFVLALTSGAGLVVDLVARPWPDAPRAAETALVAAWKGGVFGPTAHPGALARARQQSWTWEGAAEVASRHAAFLRLRTVVPLSGEGGLPVGHDPQHELSSLAELAADLLRLKGASALFLPGGEALRSPAQVEEVRRTKAGLGGPPLDLWTNIRGVGLGQHGGRTWMMVDVVGMGQLRQLDQEAIFEEGAEDAEAIAPLLLNACHHLLKGKGIADGSTADDGAGRRWTARAATGLLAPRRQVVRWVPAESAAPDAEVQASLEKLRRG